MARIRTIKPDFFTSPGTAEVDFPVRIFYQALWCNADDFGIGETSLNTLLGLAFPDSDGFTAQDVRRFCADCARAYETVFYTVRGRHFYAIPSWEKHQKLERRADRRRYPTPDDPDATPDLRIYGRADSAQDWPRKNGADSVLEGEREGEVGRGTGEDDYPLPPEPPADDPGESTDVVVDAPDFVGTTERRSKRHASQASKTFVRQAVGYSYPNTTIDRLAVQVEKLRQEHLPETVIVEALKVWDEKPAGALPEWLPTIVGDVVKDQRAVAVKPTSKLRSFAELAAEARAQEQAENGPKELPA